MNHLIQYTDQSIITSHSTLFLDEMIMKGAEEALRTDRICSTLAGEAVVSPLIISQTVTWNPSAFQTNDATVA